MDLNRRNDPSKKIDFVMLYEVHKGNPNGDPNNDNAPRRDCNGRLSPSGICIKRSIRDYIDIKELAEIYIKSGPSLQSKRHETLGKDITKSNDIIEKMINKFFDVKFFGAVFPASSSSGKENANYKGPMVIFDGECVHDVCQNTEECITRVCKEDKIGESTFGTKHIVPYALIKVYGSYFPKLSRKSSGGYFISEDDLKLFWKALVENFELNFSNSKGRMSFVKCFIFIHDNEFGNLACQKLFSRITIEYQGKTKYPEGIEDFKITTDFGDLEGKGIIVEEI